jgi:hypothetical protein
MLHELGKLDHAIVLAMSDASSQFVRLRPSRWPLLRDAHFSTVESRIAMHTRDLESRLATFERKASL